MNRYLRFFPGIILAFFPLSLRVSAFVETPPWVEQVKSLPIPEVDPQSNAVVLIDEATAEIDAAGVEHDVHRVAIKILKQSGCSWAEGQVDYNGKSERCRLAQAWLLRGGKAVKSKNKDDWIDRNVAEGGTIYDESLEKFIDLKDDAAAADIFAFETRVDRPLLVAQIRHSWGWSIPVLAETFRVSVPKGFALTPSLHGAPAPFVESSADHRTMTWTLRNQPLYVSEPFAPERSRVQPDLLLTIVPPAEAHTFTPVGFANWHEVAQWAETLSTGCCDRSAALVEESQKLTKNCPDKLSIIQALGQRVQNIHYVEVNTNLATGDGFKPRKASEVFARSYGDCKDKVNLLRAMLREVGITSHPAEANATENYFVWSECPTPVQFNHAILAIEVDDSILLPAVVRCKNGQRLLFFDPTDEFTAVGDLPAVLQGSPVHLLCDAGDSLILLPQIPTSVGHALERTVNLIVAADGSAVGKATVTGLGQCGTNLRYAFYRDSNPAEIQRHVTDLLGDRVRGALLSDEVRNDDVAHNRCGESFTFTKKNFLQTLSDSLAVVHLDVLSHKSVPTFSSKQRTLPVDLKPMLENDTIEVQLPDAFSAAELPPAVSLDSEYGSFSVTCEAREHTLVYHRQIELKRKWVPVEDYAKMRKFFSDIAKADKAPLLIKTRA